MNIDSATNADIQYDGADPILKLNNTVGPALEANSMIVTSAATIAMGSLDVNTPILAANATITGTDIRGASVASGAVMSFSGDAAYSLATIKATTGGVAGTYGVRVVLPDGTFGWLPVYPDAAVTADAVA